MLKLLAAMAAFGCAVLTLLFYPHEYLGHWYVLHDRSVGAGTAQLLRIALPLAVVLLVAAGVWSAIAAARWSRSGHRRRGSRA